MTRSGFGRSGVRGLCWPDDWAACDLPLKAVAATPATSAQNARRAMILSRIPPHPRTAPGTADDHRADYDGAEGVTPDRGLYARSGALRQIGAVVGRPVFGAPQDDARRGLDQAEAAPQPGVAARNRAGQRVQPALMDPLAGNLVAQARHAAAAVILDPARDAPLRHREDRGRLCRAPTIDQHALDNLRPLDRRDLAAAFR